MKLHEDPPAEISHTAHPEHKLKLVSPDGAQFSCNGCKEPGDGPRYTCHSGCCNFDLHTCCALAKDKDTLLHPLFGNKRAFKFLREPPTLDRRVCDACAEPARGFVYHCREKDLDLHPCCATLQTHFFIRDDGQYYTFELRGKAPHWCAICRENGRGRNLWAYRSYYNGSSVHLHVACVKEMARRIWAEAYQSRVGGGGCIVQASVPILEGVLQNWKTRSCSGLDKFVKIVGAIAKIIVAVIFGNPMALIAALAGPSGFLRG